MISLTPPAAIVKPAPETFAPITIDATDAHLVSFADEPSDAEYDVMADEAAVMDLMEAGIASW